MRVRRFALAVSLLLAAPAFADTPNPQTAQNWNVFHKLYPARALAAREEGAVGFLVTIDEKGYVKQCKVTHSSGHPLLDQETCNLITLHAEFKPQAGLSGSQSRTSEGVIAWKLPGSTTAIAAPTQVAASDMDTVVCKKSIRTGTLGGVDRTCLTKREWRKQADEMKEPWDEIQGRKGSSKGN